MKDHNWKRGDVLETPKGEQFMFGHYDVSGFWVHRITKAGKMDNSSLGKWISREGVKPAALDLSKRGGWPKAARSSRRPSKPKAAKRPHRWCGAGYVCADCGAIKDTELETAGCPGSGETGFDLWLYHAGAGWWLDEEGIDTGQKAARLLARKVGSGNVVAGAILPTGQPLGLFTKRYGS